MYYTVAVLSEVYNCRRLTLCEYIKSSKIDTPEKLTRAIAYLEKNTHVSNINMEEFDKAAGVGVVMTE